MSRKKVTTPNKNSKPTQEQADELADQISAVLTNPLTPRSIYRALAESLSELYTPAELIDLPEYLRPVVRNHFGLDWKGDVR